MSLTLLTALVLAWPADMVHDVAVDREKFVKLGAVDWVEAEDATIASAERLDSGEVLISGHKAGRTHVLLYAEGRFAVWTVRVGAKPEQGSTEAAKKACPGLELTPDQETKLTVSVQSDTCYRALFDLLHTDAFVARELEITFESKVLQAQLKAMQAALPKSLKTKYVGAGLVIEGEVTPAQHRQVLWQLFRNSVGRVALDDRLELTAPR